ncbi:hypothetical protein CPLU01_14734 [Colletotrichum plurivorum]|uniref:Uncharacterized protein n=1 Tax=Colletotrichum plurivorum TaxID=2175906 RepID=A0A8H6JI82_9PEZI|nr:hypothetical protein CPLU01_14734 [Colletotrichum plurivorum]
MKFSVVFAIFTTVAMAANIPGFEGDGLEKRQRDCTIGAAVRAPLVKCATPAATDAVASPPPPALAAAYVYSPSEELVPVIKRLLQVVSA